MVRRLLQPLFAVYVIITFVAGFILLFPLFLMHSARRSAAGRESIYRIIRRWAQIWLWVIGMPLRISGPQPPNQRYIIVCNHISYMDTVVLFPALPGYFRPLGKKEFSKVPLLGFLYRQIVIMVNRSSPESRAKSMRIMWRALRKESSIIIFPEGTFNETGDVLKSFFDGAFRLAITSQTPILPIVFPDTVHRWHYSGWWKLWPGRNRAIYLPPVSVAGMTMDELPALKEKVWHIMAGELSRYDYP